MAQQDVTDWLHERKPKARVSYAGMDDDEIHIWDLDVPGSDHDFRLGIPDRVVQDEALLSERLMELETQGWLDQAGEKDIWVLVAAGEIGHGPGLFERGEG